MALVSGTFGVFVTMTGVVLGGMAMLKWNYKKLLYWLGVVEIFTSFAFAGFAMIGANMYAFFAVILFDSAKGSVASGVDPEIIEMNISKLFLSNDVICSAPYRIMRNADLTIEAVLFLLSVKQSIIIATPLGPYPSYLTDS